MPPAAALAVVLLLVGSALALSTGAGQRPAGPHRSFGAGSTGPDATALATSLNATPEAGYTPLLVDFEANVSGASPGSLVVRWTFGDGTVEAGGLSVSYRYATAGRYVATVSVEDSLGDWGNASLPIYAVAPAVPAPSLNPAQIAGVLVAGVGIGVVAAFVVYLAIGRRGRPPVSEQDRADGDPGTGYTSGPVPPVRSSPPESTAPSSEPRGPAPAPASDPGEPTLAERRRASDDIIVHLARLGRLLPDEPGDPARTQGGMGEQLAMPQNVVSPLLRRLVAAGVVAVEVRHVRNGRRRMKVYRLTDRGQAIARELRAR